MVSASVIVLLLRSGLEGMVAMVLADELLQVRLVLQYNGRILVIR
jgi:hypothetical protein